MHGRYYRLTAGIVAVKYVIIGPIIWLYSCEIMGFISCEDSIILIHCWMKYVKVETSALCIQCKYVIIETSASLHIGWFCMYKIDHALYNNKLLYIVFYPEPHFVYILMKILLIYCTISLHIFELLEASFSIISDFSCH